MRVRIVLVIAAAIVVNGMSIISVFAQGGTGRQTTPSTTKKTRPAPSPRKPIHADEPIKSDPIIISNADLEGEYVFTLPSTAWRVTNQEKKTDAGNVQILTQLSRDSYKTVELGIAKNIYNTETKVSDLSLVFDVLMTKDGKATKQAEVDFNGNLKGKAVTYSGNFMGKEKGKVYYLQADTRTVFMVIANGSTVELAEALTQIDQIAASIRKK